MKTLPPKKKGLARIIAAFFYSIDGLKQALTKETAFKQEFIIYLLAIIPLYFIPINVFFKSLLLLAQTIILIVELLNSAIEAVVDLNTLEYNILAKKAKDFGSAAVLISIILALTLWILALLSL